MSKPAPWRYDRLVACVGGPLDKQWFTDADWQIRVAAAGRMLAHWPTGPRSPALGYTTPHAGDMVTHPREPGVKGAAARWRGGETQCSSAPLAEARSTSRPANAAAATR